MQPIYLDHAATSPLRPEVRDAMLPYLGEVLGNPSSLHSFGQRAKRSLEEARRSVAGILGAAPAEIIFTSGATESDNLAIQGVARAGGEARRHLITTPIEHHAVLHVVEALAEQGYEVTYVPVDRAGLVDPGAVGAALRPDTLLVSVMLANNEVGTIEPLREIAAAAHAAGALVHTDAVQAVGKLPVRVDDLGVDLLSLTAHKFHGPRGAGVLYVRRGTPIAPLFYGGQQERALRPGTENLAGIVGLAAALRLAVADMSDEAARTAALRERLLAGLTGRLAGVHVNGHLERRLPHILNVSFEDVDGETLLLALDTQGIAASIGSACNAGSTEPSHVLLAMGVPRPLALGTLRFSLGRDNTAEQIDYVVDVVVRTVETLRGALPAGATSDACADQSA